MKERKWELDIIRIIACFMVIMIHVTGYGMEAKDPVTLEWKIRNIVMCMVRSAVPIFFMISGCLFLNREISVKQLYRKYTAHIVTVWAIWSALYAGIDYIAALKNGNVSVVYFLEKFAEGHYHLWFLPALTGVYLMYPVLRILIQHSTDSQVKYLGILVLLCVTGKKTLDPFISLPVWDTVWDNLGFPEFSTGMIYFVLGYYLYRYYEKYSSGFCMAVYAGSVTLMYLINQNWALRLGTHTNVTYHYSGIWVFLASSSLFVLLVTLLKKDGRGEKTKRIIFQLSDHTFGIYLIHTLFIEQVYRRMGLTQDKFPVLLSITGFSVLTFLLSFLTAWCIRKVPFFGKRVI